MNPETLVNEGAAHLSRGEPGAALALLRRAVDLVPDLAAAHFNLGLAQAQAGDAQAAVASYERAVALDPSLVPAHINLGNLLARHGDLDRALENYRRALALRPEHPNALLQAGATLRRLGRAEESRALLEHAHRRAPDDPRTLDALGRTCVDLDDLEAAYQYYRAALGREPSAARHVNLGAVCGLRGEHEQALTHYERAVALDPNSGLARWNRAVSRLTLGHWPEAWPDFAARRNTPEAGRLYRHRYDVPHWRGESFAGRRLLLHYEQGFGDSLLALRYLPRVKTRGGTVLCEVQAPLARLAASCAGIDEVIAAGAEPVSAHVDLQCSLWDLPGLFGTTVATVPAAVPYLHADPAAVAAWSRRLGPGFKVGLTWRGSRVDPSRLAALKQRVCSPRDLAPLATVAGLRCYAVQKDATPEELRRAAPFITGNLATECGDFADTAALLSALDLVITVDTAVAHLAGALGRPTWILLGHQPDWRWLLARDDSPWYPTARLFRRERGQDWGPVVARVIRALRTQLRP